MLVIQVMPFILYNMLYFINVYICLYSNTCNMTFCMAPASIPFPSSSSLLTLSPSPKKGESGADPPFHVQSLQNFGGSSYRKKTKQKFQIQIQILILLCQQICIGVLSLEHLFLQAILLSVVSSRTARLHLEKIHEYT